jgi:cytoskeletal protein RodZ
MSIEDVAQVTKIPRASLEAIEADRLDGLPAPVFVRGFIRAFATTVGLDGNELLRQMQGEAVGTAGARAAAEHAAARRPGDLALLAAHTEGTRRGFGGSQLLLLVLAIGMVLAAWMMVGKKPKADSERAPTATPTIQQPVDGVSSFSDAYVNSSR